MKSCHVWNLGTVDYQRAWQLQKTLAWQVYQEERPNTLLLLEHLPVYTIGRRGRRDQILLDQERLGDMGVALYEVDRGGEVTYHGPGQLVVYPIVNLGPWGGPLKYVRTLEQILIKTLADYDIKAGLLEGRTGVWVDEEKIGAIGIKISRGVAYHGLSVNVNTNLDFFQYIIPCGIPDKGITSMEKLLGVAVDMDVVAYSLRYHFGRLMGLHMVEEMATWE